MSLAALDLTRMTEPGVDVPLLASLRDARPAWMADGLCREYPDVSFFPNRYQSPAHAKRVCSSCLVQLECLAFALAEGIRDGVWGGLSAPERQHFVSHRAAA